MSNHPNALDTTPADATAWVAALLATVDAKDADRFVEMLTDDARFTYANQPSVSGRAAVHAAVTGFFTCVRSLAHSPTHVWAVPGHVIVEGNVRYERRDGREVTLPFVNVLAVRDDRIADYRIYIDGTPLFSTSAG